MAYIDETGLEYYSSLVKEDINTKANIDSPALTGIPTAPTPEDSTNESRIATVGYINGVESSIEDVKNTAEQALSTATDAQTSANEAQASANEAQTSASNAQTDANTAIETANEALYLATQAATGNYAPVNHASDSEMYGLATEDLYGHVKLIDYGTDSFGPNDGVALAPSALYDISETVDEAKQMAEQAEQDADTALSTSESNTDLINDLSTNVNNMISYNSVGDVDVDEYFDSLNRIYVTSGSSNIPTSTESFYIAVDVTDDMSSVRQLATGAATGRIYIRNGTLEDVSGLPLTPTSGTVIINGNLECDLVVNGNIQITGSLSAEATATGTITYGSLNDGVVNQNAEVSSEDCNISVDGGGSLTFYGGLTENRTTNEMVVNEATTIIYSEIIVNTDSEYSFQNIGNLTVSSTGTLSLTNTSGAGYALYNTGNLNVNGTIYITIDDENRAIYGNVDGYGIVYVNDEVYYNGGGSDSDTSNYTVTWDNWILSGTDVYLPLSGGDMKGDLGMGDGNVFTANGLTITAEGHIKLPSGVEFY